MWKSSYSVTVKDIQPSEIWKIWSDIKLRTLWDDDTEWVEMEGPFRKGAVFFMKVLNGPKLKMHITECIPNEIFTDTYYFPLARLDGVHELQKTSDGLCIKTTIKMSGILRWFWQKCVGEKIVRTLPHQTDLLIQLARKLK